MMPDRTTHGTIHHPISMALTSERSGNSIRSHSGTANRLPWRLSVVMSKVSH